MHGYNIGLRERVAHESFVPFEHDSVTGRNENLHQYDMQSLTNMLIIAYIHLTY